MSIFSICVVFRYLCTLGNYVESRFGQPSQRRRVTTAHTVHVGVYGVVTLVLPVLYFVDIVVYKMEGRTGLDSPMPWCPSPPPLLPSSAPPRLLFAQTAPPRRRARYVLQVMDIIWVLCLATSKHFSVPEPPLKVTS